MLYSPEGCIAYKFSDVVSLAVASSPRPWIDVFALPEKINMAVTESDLDT